MNLLSAIFLGIVQGLTEFLPISSSGHLVILQTLIPSFSQPGVLFDVFLHLGTLLSVIIHFRRSLLKYLSLHNIILLAIGTLPAVIMGLLLKSQIEVLFQSVKLVGVALLVTGFINLLTDRLSIITNQKSKISKQNALVTGLAQAVAIIPGISRSGSTIFASVAQKIDRKSAAEFSFILSIPAILGANLLQVVDNISSLNGNCLLYLVGFLTAVVAGLLSINLVYKILLASKYKYFAYYCFMMGIVAFLI